MATIHHPRGAATSSPSVEGLPSRFWNPTATADESGIRRAARLTFTGVSDDPESHYYQAPGLTPDETVAAVLERVEHVASAAALDALAGNELRPRDVAEMHSVIFGPIFKQQTLRQRAHPKEISYYGVTKGPRMAPVQTTQSGTGGGNVRTKMREAFKRFERERLAVQAAAQDRPLPIADAVRPAAKLYARVIGIHPFVDGNGRTGFCVLTHALIRCGGLAVALPEDDGQEFHWCLGQAMRRDRAPDYEPLTELMAHRVLASSE